MGFEPGMADVELLSRMAEHRVLTCRQLALLERRNLRALRRRIRELAAAGLVLRAPGRPSRKAGRPDFVISVSDEGAALLRNRGHLERRTNLGDVIALAERLIPHQLLVNEFRVCLAEMEQRIPEVTVRFMSPDSPFVPHWEAGSSTMRERMKTPDGQRFELVPDGAVAITHVELGRTLLFFLEADMGTETRASARGHRGDLWHKIVKYQCYFRSNRYRRYETIWQCSFRGFRLLILTRTRTRRESVCSLLREMGAPEFVLATDLASLLHAGAWGDVWVSGGRTETPSVSILGGKMPTSSSVRRVLSTD